MSWMLAACTGAPGEGDGFRLRPTRGYILVSLDTLRADRLGGYGHDRPTSPFFDRLAERGTLFEHALAPYPATLVSHMSLFTGLYPPQHGVYPPAVVLPERIPTLPQRFQGGGFRTQAHTEGGFVGWGFGFERGFEIYDDIDYSADTDIESTFERGLDFLRSMEAEERYFLFLHTYSVHDPYDPPSRYLEQFGEGEPHPDSRGVRLRAFNHQRAMIPAAEVERFEHRYEASIRYVDSVLESFVAALEGLGLLADTTLVITSDHGEEFLEHGKLGHTQLFPESLEVPLLILHPDLTGGRRVADQVSLVDVAPTLVELAGLPELEGIPGRSLVPYLHDPLLRQNRLSYAEIEEVPYLRSLFGEVDGRRYQLLVDQIKADTGGAWVQDSAALDFFGSPLEMRSRSYHEARRVTVRVDGEVVDTLEVTPQWRTFVIDLPGDGLQRIELESDGCVRPSSIDESGDTRCLAFIVQGPPLATARLFDLVQDPGASRDVSRSRPLVVRRMMRELEARQWAAVGGVKTRELSAEDKRRLRALGYLD
ncbi:MAG: sulfatase [Acidobacteria bacterium]|nr:sulfatase [Acidobacteriota bacterium]